MNYFEEIIKLTDQLNEETQIVQQLKDYITQISLEHTQIVEELEETRKKFKAAKNQYKKSSETHKKRNKELTGEVERLSKEVEEARNLNASEQKLDNLNVSKFEELTVEEKVQKELKGLRIQRKLDADYIIKLKEELRASNEKITDLENVLEAHQLEIEDYKEEIKELNKTLNVQKSKTGSNNSIKKNKDDPIAAELLKVLDLLISTKKRANDIANHLNSNNYKNERSDFDEHLRILKAENEALINSINVVQLTKRASETLEKDLDLLRNENNQKIKSARKQVLDVCTKLKTLYEQYTKSPQSIRTSIKQCTKELEGLSKVKLDVLFENEDTLQKEVIKKLLNEKELLNTILSKQNDI